MLKREWFRTVNVGGLPAAVASGTASYSSSSIPRAKMSLLAFAVVVFRTVDSDWSGSEVSAEPERASDKKTAAAIRNLKNWRGLTVTAVDVESVKLFMKRRVIVVCGRISNKSVKERNPRRRKGRKNFFE